MTRVPDSGSFTYTIDVGDTAREVVFVFSASADSSTVSYPSVETLSVDGFRLPVPAAPENIAEGVRGERDTRTEDRRFQPERVVEVRAGPGRQEFDVWCSGSTAAGPQFVSIGDPNTFEEMIIPSNGVSIDYIPNRSAHCYALRTGIAVEADSTPRNLYIWVSDNDYGTNNGAGIDSAMVNALADKFLQAGANNDIYDWLTAVIGAEWGATEYTNLIDHSGDIHILLTDIVGDENPDGGIVGFFYAANNYTKSSYSSSNEKIMFVIDSYMYANDDDAEGNAGNGWDVSDYWPQEIFSTLAHEFQHMIHFYQKGLVHGAGDSADTWIDEMCAQIAEDLLADKMGVPGPRGVEATDGTAGSTGNKTGRIPLYNQIYISTAPRQW